MATDDWSTLSQRAQKFAVDLDYVNNYSSWPAVENTFDEISNPEGIINFGTAVSGLMNDIWLERFKEQPFFQPDPSHFRYYQFWGPDPFRESLAKFMTAFFHPREPIQFENLFVLNGALLALDILGLLLADEGDSFVFITPAYGSYFHAGVQRWNIKVVPAPLSYNPDSTIVDVEPFQWSTEALEKIISDELERGGKVRAFVFNNPENPLGKVFSEEVTEDVMRMCQRLKIHLIADEMYCMSVFDNNSTFHSLLEIHSPQLLDPNFLHVIWGFSKDLCLTGFRTGLIHTKNKALQLALKSGSQFQAVPLPMMNMLQNVIGDIDWFKETFVPTHHSRLKQSYQRSKSFFQRIGFKTTETHAGFFFLVDFRPLFKNYVEKDEPKALIRKFYEHKIYMTPSWEMGAPDGWFRFVFSGYNEKGLDLGLQRLEKAIAEWKLDQDHDEVSVN